MLYLSKRAKSVYIVALTLFINLTFLVSCGDLSGPAPNTTDDEDSLNNNNNSNEDPPAIKAKKELVTKGFDESKINGQETKLDDIFKKNNKIEGDLMKSQLVEKLFKF